MEDSDVIEMYATPIVVYDVEQQSFRRYLEGDSSGYEPGEQLRAAVQDIHDIRDIRIEVDSFNDILARIPDDDYLEKIDRIF